MTVSPSLQLDEGPGELLAHAAPPLGEARLQEAEDDEVLATQLRLALQLSLAHRVKPGIRYIIGAGLQDY